MFEQAELQGTQMGPNGPPNAKGTAQIAPEIANKENERSAGCRRSHLGKDAYLNVDVVCFVCKFW